MDREVGEFQPAGFVLAVLGFALTRFVIVDAITVDTAVPFFIAGLLPLVGGLGLTVFGVVLAVGSFNTEYTRTVTAWALLGTAAMVAVLAASLAGTLLQEASVAAVFDDSGTLIANVLVGGAIGGTVTGDRAATNRTQRRQIQRQADRGIIVNRILRHEVLNAAAIVGGYADLLEEQSDSAAVTAIREEADRIDTTINEVGQLIDPRQQSAVDVAATVESVSSQYGEDVTADVPDESACVSADDRLEWVVRELVDNAVTYGAGDETVAVGVNAQPTTVTITVRDHGGGLPADQRAILTDGSLPEFDDPGAGFGLQVVALLVDQYDGEVAVRVEEGTEITVTLPRAVGDTNPSLRAGVPRDELLPIAGISTLAALVMGVYLDFSVDLLPVIGSLYGVENATVGWTTHVFHSVVFGLLFAAMRESPLLGTVSQPLRASIGSDKPVLYGGVAGIGWGLALAVVAAGVMMPVWLLLVGVDAAIPNLTLPGVVGHVLWGVVLGVGYELVKKR